MHLLLNKNLTLKNVNISAKKVEFIKNEVKIGSYLHFLGSFFGTYEILLI